MGGVVKRARAFLTETPMKRSFRAVHTKAPPGPRLQNPPSRTRVLTATVVGLATREFSRGVRYTMETYYVFGAVPLSSVL